MSEVKFVDENGTEFVFNTADDLKEYLSGGECKAKTIKRPVKTGKRELDIHQKENGDFVVEEEGKGKKLITKDMDIWKELNNLLGEIRKRKTG